jgi:quinol monooxygenase YgiN
MSVLLTALTLLSIPQEQEDPLVAMVKASLADTSKPFTVIVRLKVKEGQGPNFEAAVGKAVKETRKEKGNKTYELNRAAKGPDYVLYERWENLAALEAHLKSPHFSALMAEVGTLVAEAPEIQLFVPASD